MDRSFSIVVPFHNTDIGQVRTCLESLVAQDLALLREIIVVDDGSSETSAARIDALVDELNTHTHTHTHKAPD